MMQKNKDCKQKKISSIIHLNQLQETLKAEIRLTSALLHVIAESELPPIGS